VYVIIVLVILRSPGGLQVQGRLVPRPMMFVPCSLIVCQQQGRRHQPSFLSQGNCFRKYVAFEKGKTLEVLQTSHSIQRIYGAPGTSLCGTKAICEVYINMSAGRIHSKTDIAYRILLVTRLSRRKRIALLHNGSVASLEITEDC
jgi:hypothetical protein